MRVWVFNKKNIVMILFAFLILILSLSLSLNTIPSLLFDKGEISIFSKQEKKLPIYSVETSKSQIALTFNAAWGNGDIDKLLNILKYYNVKASFFFVGDWVEKYPEDTKKIYLAGHCMGNHSYSHKNMPSLSREEIYKDILKCNELISKITGGDVLYFRAPSGAYDNKTIEAAEMLNMQSIQWDVDSIDWKDPSADEIITRINEKARKGSILLFHTGKENTQKALPTIIKSLKDGAYSFVTIDELIYKDSYYIDNAGRQKKLN